MKIVEVFGTPVNAITLEEGIKKVIKWGRFHQSRTINFCNVHSVVTAAENPSFSKILKSADINFPDGGPIARWLRKSGFKYQRRVSGPDFMLSYLAAVKNVHEKIYLYGSTDQVLDNLRFVIAQKFPWVEIVGSYSPPFKADTGVESEEFIKSVRNSGANTLWVSLGCPKQEKWLYLHRNKINCVMLAVGAAFPLISGDIKRAPEFMRNNSLEWLYRLCMEPRRLIGRYITTNIKFMIKSINYGFNKKN